MTERKLDEELHIYTLFRCTEKHVLTKHQAKKAQNT